MNNAPPTLPPAASTSDDQGTQIREFVAHLYKYKWLVLLAAAIACGSSYVWTTRQPRIYDADCTIEYDTNPTRPLGGRVEDVADPMAFRESREHMTTQNKIIGSRFIAERVVRKLGLHLNADFAGIRPELRNAWNGISVTDAAQMLQAKVSVSAERDTRLTHVIVRDTDPDRAALLANSMVDAYVEKTIEDRLGSTTGALEWLSKQLDTLKTQLEQSEVALHEFTGEQKRMSVSLDDQKSIVASDVSMLSARLSQQRVKVIELGAQLKTLQEGNSDNPLAVSGIVTKGHNSADAAKSRYQELEAERATLSLEYGDAHPKIRAIDAEMDTMRTLLRRAIDDIIASTDAELREAARIQSGLSQALAEANRRGMDVNLQEITYRRLQRERDNAGELYGTLLARTAETDLAHALQVSYVRVVDRALPKRSPVSPRVRSALMTGSLLGAVLGIALTFLLARLDRVIRTPEDAEALGLTVLGIMPRIEDNGRVQGPAYARKKRRQAPERITNRDLIVHTHPKSSVAECFRTIRTNLTFMSADSPRRTLVVTSASPREGKTTVTLSLAISLAQSGKRVLVVDTDLRKPRMHRALGKSSSKGVSSILAGEGTAGECIQNTEIPGLHILPSGPIPPNPAELLHTPQFAALVRELARDFDQVIFDSPPLGAVTDAAIIAPQVDGALLVIHSQTTTRDALRSALRQLRDVKCHLTGGVLNDVDLSSRPYGYGSYYYYHSEGYSADNTPDEPPKEESKRPRAQA